MGQTLKCTVIQYPNAFEMSSPATFDDALGPDEWEAVPVTGADLEDSVSARYRNTETNFILEICEQSSTRFFVRVLQPISAEEYSTTITSHSSPSADADGVLDDAREFMRAVTEDRDHNVRCLGIDVWDGGVDFICAYDDELPDAVTPEIATDVASYVLDQDPTDPTDDVGSTDVPDPEADSMVTLDIFPRSFNRTSGGDVPKHGDDPDRPHP